jgi:hypothetical protein
MTYAVREKAPSSQVTDSIPRAGIAQLLDAVAALDTAGGKTTFDAVRDVLQRGSSRRAPASREAMWTVARDVLSDLQRLGYAVVGMLPRKRSEVDRLRSSPCELTDAGKDLAKVLRERQGHAYDELLISWVNEHPYFRQFTARLAEGPIYVPDVTNVKQVGVPSQSEPLVDRVIASCATRLAAIAYPSEKRDFFAQAVRERVAYVENHARLADLDAKKWIDAIEDLIVIPAFLAAERLPFDAVTFQQLIRASQDFLSASWTYSYPAFEGRVIFSTCEFEHAPGEDAVKTVVHHGKTYADGLFRPAFSEAYRQLAEGQSGYVDAYVLRALVCVGIRIQPSVFARSLEEVVRTGRDAGMTIFTELPFTPPPIGEQYVEMGSARIGLIKVVLSSGDQ